MVSNPRNPKIMHEKLVKDENGGEELKSMLKYVKENAEKSGCRLDMPQLWKNYAEDRNSSEKWTHFDLLFRVQMAPKIYKCAQLDKKAKVRILYCTGTPVNEQFLTELKREAYVQVTEDNIIFYYKEKKEGGFKLPSGAKKKPAKRGSDEEVGENPEYPPKGSLYTKQEETQMLDFLAEKSATLKTVISMRAMWIEYKKKFRSTRDAKSLHYRFRCHLGPSIHALSRYDNRTKVRMLHASSTPVNKRFLEELRKGADVSVDERGLFVYYREHTSSLQPKAEETHDFFNYVVKEEHFDEEPNFSIQNDEEQVHVFNSDVVKEEPIDEYCEEDVKPNIEELKLWAASSHSDSFDDFRDY